MEINEEAAGSGKALRLRLPEGRAERGEGTGLGKNGEEEVGMREPGAEQKESLGMAMSDFHFNIQVLYPKKTTKQEDSCGTQGPQRVQMMCVTIGFQSSLDCQSCSSTVRLWAAMGDLWAVFT